MEQWKYIPGFEGLYQASTYGRIRSVDRLITMRRKTGNFPKTIKGKLLTAYTNDKKRGCLMVCLLKDYKKSHLLVHRLVAMTFIPNPKNKRTVNHKDGVPFNNKVSNLEWYTHSEQMYHSYKLGLHKYTNMLGGQCKVNEEQVREIRLLCKRGESNKPIAIKYGVSLSVIDQIESRRAWRHVK